MKKVLIIINGYSGVGKDTFADKAIREFESNGIAASKFSSIDNVKSAMTLLGWNGERNAVSRQIMSDLKDMSTSKWNGPMRSMELYIKNSESRVIFLAIREPEEIGKFVDQFPGTKTLLIEKKGVSQYHNHADQGIRAYPYDEIIYNNSTLEALHISVTGYVSDIVSEDNW